MLRGSPVFELGSSVNEYEQTTQSVAAHGIFYFAVNLLILRRIFMAVSILFHLYNREYALRRHSIICVAVD